MFSKKWLINICLAGLAVFIGVQANAIWSREVVIAPDTTAAPALPPVAPVEVAEKGEMTAAGFDTVVERNLFAPEREEIIYVAPEPKKKPGPKKKPPVSKKQEQAIGQMTLLGVVVSEGRRTALVQARQKRTKKARKAKAGGARWVFEGDEIEGMQIAEIQDEKIRLVSGEVELELLLYDPDKPKKRTAVKRATQPTVLITGGATASKKVAKKRTRPTKKAVTKAKKQTSKKRTTPKRTMPKQTNQPQTGRKKSPVSSREKS